MHIITILTTTIVALASATPLKIKRWPSDSTSLSPSSISIYHGQTGAITPNVLKGEISRENWNGRDNSTLVTFDIRGRTLPATCSFRFILEGSDPDAHVSGTTLVDVFGSMQPAPASGSAGWGGPGNQRYLPIGRFKVRYNGAADAVPDVAPNALGAFPCPKVGDANVRDGRVGFEVVPVGDRVRVQWGAGVSGLLLDWQ